MFLTLLWNINYYENLKCLIMISFIIHVGENSVKPCRRVKTRYLSLTQLKSSLSVKGWIVSCIHEEEAVLFITGILEVSM